MFSASQGDVRCVVIVTLLCMSPPAFAAGTFMTTEVRSGVVTPAYRGGDPGASVGAAFGLTFRLSDTPLRLAVFSNIAVQFFHDEFPVAGIMSDAERISFDAYVSLRPAVVVHRGLRLYCELGVGYRFLSNRVDATGLTPLQAEGGAPLVVIAPGLQYRFGRLVSLGVRVELEPLGRDVDLIAAVAHVAPGGRGVTGLLHLGFHF